MVKQQELIYAMKDIEAVVQTLQHITSYCDVFTFTGPLGAGKTTLIQHLLRLNGVKGVITSPTFTYVNVYHNYVGATFYHFDCYRIATLDAFLEAGFGEYIYQPNSWSFIEWPEAIRSLLPTNVCHISLDYYGDDKRILSYDVVREK